jgi:mRNA interferase MazF
MNIRRGDIFLAALDPVIGKEIAKTRPVVVVSNDFNNRYSGTVTILPVTSKHLEKIYPFEVLIPRGRSILPKDSKVKADQIRTLDRRRLLKFIGKLEAEDLEAIAKAIQVHLSLERIF